MKKATFLVLMIIAVGLAAQPMKTVNKISWYGQAAVSIEHMGKHVFIDPLNIPDGKAADLILITHAHGDHLSLSDIEKIYGEETVIVCPYDCKEILKDNGYSNIIPVSPGDDIEASGFPVEAVPMYNIVKSRYHPQENNWTGFIIDIGGTRVYHAGDTERIPEMKKMECDIAMLPLGQTYTMNSVREAADAALDTEAEIAIPIHYGMYEGSKDDAREFKRLLKGSVRVVILDRAK